VAVTAAVAVIAAITAATTTTLGSGVLAVARPVSLLAASEASVGVGSPGTLGPFNGDSGSENGYAVKVTQGILGISPVLVLNKAITSLHIAASELAILVEQILQISGPAVEGESSCNGRDGKRKADGAVSRLNRQAGTSRAN